MTNPEMPRQEPGFVSKLEKRNQESPLYRQLATDLELQIASELFTGGKLPPEGTITAAYGISRDTTREAINYLTKQGILTVREGKGTFIAESGGKKAMSTERKPHGTKQSSIAAAIITEILTGDLAAGGKLQKETVLMERFGCSKNTVRGGLSLLRDRGILRSQQGKGTFLDSDLPETEELEELIKTFTIKSAKKKTTSNSKRRTNLEPTFISKLDRKKPLPGQIAEDLQVNIARELFSEGTLPSGKIISAAYGVSERTTATALSNLEEKGIIKTRHGTLPEIIDRTALEKIKGQPITVYERPSEEDEIAPHEHGKLVSLIEKNSSFSTTLLRTTVGLNAAKYIQLKDGHRELSVRALRKLVALVDTQPNNSEDIEEVTVQIQDKFPHTRLEGKEIIKKIIDIGSDVGMTYDDIAECIGKGRNTIKAMLRGAFGLTVENAEKILTEVYDRKTRRNKAIELLKENNLEDEGLQAYSILLDLTMVDALIGIRTQYGISQGKLGGNIPGGNQVRISRFELQKRKPTKKDIAEIVEAFQRLGVPEDDSLLIFLKEKLSD